MGQSGCLTFFTESRLEDPRLVLWETLGIVGSDTILLAARTLEPSREWQAFQEALDRPRHIVEIDEESVPTEYIKQVIPIKEVPKLYHPEGTLNVTFGKTPLGTQMEAVIKTAIPESVRSNFVPCAPSIYIGWHDIYESAEHEEGRLFGRAFFSFTLFGYGSPNDWAGFRRAVFQVPEVAALKCQLEVAAGPLEECVYWSV